MCKVPDTKLRKLLCSQETLVMFSYEVLKQTMCRLKQNQPNFFPKIVFVVRN